MKKHILRVAELTLLTMFSIYLSSCLIIPRERNLPGMRPQHSWWFQFSVPGPGSDQQQAPHHDRGHKSGREW